MRKTISCPKFVFSVSKNAGGDPRGDQLWDVCNDCDTKRHNDGLSVFEEGKRVSDHTAVKQEDRYEKGLSHKEHMPSNGTVARQCGIDGKPCQERADDFMYTNKFSTQRGNEEDDDHELELHGTPADSLEKEFSESR